MFTKKVDVFFRKYKLWRLYVSPHIIYNANNDTFLLKIHYITESTNDILIILKLGDTPAHKSRFGLRPRLPGHPPAFDLRLSTYPYFSNVLHRHSVIHP